MKEAVYLATDPLVSRRWVAVLPAILAATLFLLGGAGCATSRAQATPEVQTAKPPLPPGSGPKKRIAVAKFDAVGNFVSVYGGWDIGGGLAAQLTTALVNSGHFIVVERAELASVLREQEMALQRIVSKETAAQVSRVLGAQLLVRGSVTEFEQRAGGGGIRLGIGTGAVGGAVGGQTVNGIVGIDLRLIDTTTTQVVQSHRAERKVAQSGVSADINWNQVSLGGDAFEKTALGQATRQAIEQAVAFIIQAMERVPWTGRVVEVAGEQVYINAGSGAGLKPGDVFTVTAVVKELTDPDSGTVLGIVEDRRGDIEVVSVQEKFSIARMRAPFPATRGDLVKLPGR
jgi:curli biogenesis system outer membrane secretion channel CsgG